MEEFFLQTNGDGRGGVCKPLTMTHIGTPLLTTVHLKSFHRFSSLVSSVFLGCFLVLVDEKKKNLYFFSSGRLDQRGSSPGILEL